MKSAPASEELLLHGLGWLVYLTQSVWLVHLVVGVSGIGGLAVLDVDPVLPL